MFKNIIFRWFAFVFWAVSVAACSSEIEPNRLGDETQSPDQVGPSGQARYGLDSLVEDLGNAGLQVTLSERYPPSLLSAPIQGLLVNGEPVSVREYADAAAAAVEAGWILPQGDQISHPDPDQPESQVVTIIDPTGTPHWFRRENLILAYMGDSRTTLDGLVSVLGPQFAGGQFPAACAVPDHFQHTWTLAAPRLYYEMEVLRPPVWLAPAGQQTALPGRPGSYEISVREGDMATLIHSDSAPPSELSPTMVTLAPDEPATIIVFNPHGSIKKVAVSMGDWPLEPVLQDFRRHSSGAVERHGDLFAFTLEPAGPLSDQILQVNVEFGNDTVSGGVSYFWHLNPTEELQRKIRSRDTLFSFFDHLKHGRYLEASRLYGGSYEFLLAQNPDLAPEKRAALLERGCRVNGLQCLRLMGADLQGCDADTCTYQVEFETAEGDLFTLAACCGATETTPPQSQFTYSVRQDQQGNYLVQELPVYVP